MPDLTEKPSEKFVQDTVTYLEGLWVRAWKNWKDYDDLYHLTYGMWPDDIKAQQRLVYRPSTPTNVVDRAVDTQLAFTPRVHRPPLDINSPTSVEKANRVSGATKGIIEDASLKNMSLPYKRMGGHLIHYGYGIHELGLDFRNRPIEPKSTDFDTTDEFEFAAARFKASQRNWNPIQILAPHPTTVLLDMEKQPDVAIKLMDIKGYKLAEWTRAKKKPPGSKRARRDVQLFNVVDPYENVELVFLWTKHWTAAMVKSGEMLWRDRNLWGFVPFSHAFAGFGMDIQGEVGEASFLARGLLEPIADTLLRQGQRMSAEHGMLIDAAFRVLLTNRPPNQVAEGIARGIAPGEEDEYGLMPTGLDKVSSALFAIGAGQDLDIELNTAMTVLGGLPQSGVRTVGQTALNSNAARRKFNGPAMQLQHMASIGAQQILQLVDVVDGGMPIGVNGNILKPADIEHDYTIVVVFEEKDPVIQLQKQEIGLRELGQGAKSLQRYWREDVGLEDTSQERREILKDSVRKRPAVHEVMATQVAEEDGLGDVLEQARILEQAEAGGQTDVDLSEPSTNGASPPLREGAGGDTETQNLPRFG